MTITVCCLLYVPDTSYKSSWSAHTPTPSQGKHSSDKITLNIGKPPPQATNTKTHRLLTAHIIRPRLM